VDDHSQQEQRGKGQSDSARDAADAHVLFSNCCRDYAQVNAQRLAALRQA